MTENIPEYSPSRVLLSGKTRQTEQGVEQDQERGISAEAAEWVIRLTGSNVPDEEQARFRQWLSRDPAHRLAYGEAQTAWQALAALRDDPGPLLEESIAVPIRHRRWQAIAALAACLMLAVGLGWFWYGNPLLIAAADYRTGPAELRSVALPDGSILELGPDSAIAVRYGPEERRIALLAGMAYVTAVPRQSAQNRPFIVEAANGAATALGTRFAVNLAPDSVTVIVAAHRVAVAASAHGPAPGGMKGGHAELDPGQSVRYDRTGHLSPVTPVDVAQATAWREGLLVFDRQPLGEVVELLGRYTRRRIVIADAGLAARRVSGVFRADQAGSAVAAISRELNIGTASLPPFVTILY